MLNNNSGINISNIPFDGNKTSLDITTKIAHKILDIDDEK